MRGYSETTDAGMNDASCSRPSAALGKAPYLCPDYIFGGMSGSGGFSPCSPPLISHTFPDPPHYLSCNCIIRPSSTMLSPPGLSTNISPIPLPLPPPPPPASAPDGLPSCAVYYANLAACELKIEGHTSQAVAACSDAIELDPAYSKAYMRRSAAFEATDDLDNALTDAKKARVGFLRLCMAMPRLKA